MYVSPKLKWERKAANLAKVMSLHIIIIACNAADGVLP